MYRRRTPPYSKIEQLKRNRLELIGLVCIGLFLGLTLNIIADYFYDTIILTAKMSIWYIILITLFISFFMMLLLYYREKSDSLRLEVVIPYLVGKKTGFGIAKQHRFRPAYLAAKEALRFMNQYLGQEKKLVVEMVEKWEVEKSQGGLIQDFLHDENVELIDALLIKALDKFCEDSFGASSNRDWWCVSMQFKKLSLKDLPEILQRNRYIQAWYGHTPDWNIQIPQNVDLSIQKIPEGLIWKFNHPLFGCVWIKRFGGTAISKYGRSYGNVLGEGLQDQDRQDLFCFHNRLELSATFTMAFLPSVEPFQTWATNLLAFFEEALDWDFFMSTRSDRLIADFPWKLGDLPSGSSIWKKLEDIEELVSHKD
jgi:hypothetical protein